MYPSGMWCGFWDQQHLGRQPMKSFELRFDRGEVRGSGKDVVGKFTVEGTYDTLSGRILFIKRYIGKHQVMYEGEPDGEGKILGKWKIVNKYGQTLIGSFLIYPDLPKPTGDEPIFEITK